MKFTELIGLIVEVEKGFMVDARCFGRVSADLGSFF